MCYGVGGLTGASGVAAGIGYYLHLSSLVCYIYGADAIMTHGLRLVTQALKLVP